MGSPVETIYILENPEKDIIKFATATQLRYDDTIKEVFGVACVNDLPMMIQFNKSFQESLCRKNGIIEKNITLHHIFRIATKDELLLLREQLQSDHADSIPCPFDTVIQLQDGIFQWDDSISSYVHVKN
ncbi:hypothetical protein [Bacillus sp. FJAT-29814]|uniref:hypothetical protein n=1 Tax=Bacillus sp. FJAT-29814 TaxID=1729688 RepID=UPI000829E2A4|nr:hypothetical protein [Bacillus sp. FJAT-29814]